MGRDELIEELRSMKILQNALKPGEEDFNQIRQHEKEFEYEGDIPIITYDLNDHLREFLQGKEIDNYRTERNKVWTNFYGEAPKVFVGSLLAQKDRIVYTQIERKARTLGRVIKKLKIRPLEEATLFSSIDLWINLFTVWELWPYGDNPHRPIINLIKKGYAVRRIDGYWKIGYFPLQK